MSEESASTVVRSVYFHAVCFVATLIMLWGVIQFAGGVITAIAPRTDSDQLTQIANAIVDTIEEVAPGLGAPPAQLRQGVDAFRKGINRQARNRAVSRIISGVVFFGAGALAFALAWRRVPGQPRRMAPVSAPPPSAGYYAPQPQYYQQPTIPPGGPPPPASG